MPSMSRQPPDNRNVFGLRSRVFGSILEEQESHYNENECANDDSQKQEGVPELEEKVCRIRDGHLS